MKRLSELRWRVERVIYCCPVGIVQLKKLDSFESQQGNPCHCRSRRDSVNIFFFFFLDLIMELLTSPYYTWPLTFLHVLLSPFLQCHHFPVTLQRVWMTGGLPLPTATCHPTYLSSLLPYQKLSQPTNTTETKHNHNGSLKAMETTSANKAAFTGLSLKLLQWYVHTLAWWQGGENVFLPPKLAMAWSVLTVPDVSLYLFGDKPNVCTA